MNRVDYTLGISGLSSLTWTSLAICMHYESFFEQRHYYYWPLVVLWYVTDNGRSQRAGGGDAVVRGHPSWTGPLQTHQRHHTATARGTRLRQAEGIIFLCAIQTGRCALCMYHNNEMIS